MTISVIQVGTATITSGETTLTFDNPFSSLPTVNSSPKLKDANIYVKNITLVDFVVSASVEDEFDIDYIAMQE